MQFNSIPYELEQYTNPNPITVIGGVSIITDVLPQNLGNGRVMLINQGNGFGFKNVAESKRWFMKVDHKIDYEISFWFKQPTEDASWFLRVHVFDCFDNVLKTFDITDGTVNDTFVIIQKVICKGQQWYFARYILYGYKEPLQVGLQPITSLSEGTNLKMQKGVNQILVDLFCTKNWLKIYNFKIKPLRTPFSTGFVQGSDLLTLWRKNNNKKYTEEQVDSIATQLLFPYNTANVTISLNEKDKEQKEITTICPS